MLTDPTEGALRGVFQEARQRDAVTAPSFDQVLKRRTCVKAAFPPVAFYYAAAAAGLLLVAAVVTVLSPGGRSAAGEVDDEQLASLIEWQASTDNLLTLTDSRFDDTLTTGTDELMDMNSFLIEAQLLEKETL